MEDVSAKIAILDTKVEAIEERMNTLEQTIKKIESLTISVEKLAFSVENIAKVQKDYRNSQEQLWKKVIAVETAPATEKASKFDKLVEKIVGLVLAAVVGFLLSQVLGL